MGDVKATGIGTPNPRKGRPWEARIRMATLCVPKASTSIVADRFRRHCAPFATARVSPYTNAMQDQAISVAVARLGRALSSLEALSQQFAELPLPDSGLSARHSALRAEVQRTIAEIGALMGEPHG